MKRKIIKVLYYVLFIVPLVIGVMGYLSAGESFSNALYYSINLYGLDYEATAEPLVGLEIAKWLAPLMTATSIMLIVKKIFVYLQPHIVALRRSGNIVYGDSQCVDALCENEQDVVLYKGAPIVYAKNHLIMFDSDIENLSFCQNNLPRLKDKNVFICMSEMDVTLLKDMQKTQIKFFNPNDIVSRTFWKKIALWEKAPTEYKIALIGFENLGKRMLEKALQLNLYSKKQRIEYYVYGDTKHFEISHAEMDLMNQDQIFYYQENCREQWEKLKFMDMIVITSKPDIALVQKVLNCSSSVAKIYYFSPENEKFYDYIVSDNLYPFGSTKDIFTLKNIKSDEVYRNAIDLNNKYAKLYNGVKWEELTGFLKASNISAADYGEVICALHKKGIGDLELAELEHIRWSRFHFLHYWKYGVPKSGMNKDEKEKIHKCLIPFDALDANARSIDVEVVEMWNKEC